MSVNINNTITIDRDSQFYLGKMNIKLLVDNKDSYLFHNGESLNIVLPKGNHCLLFKYSFRSKTVNVNLTKDTKLLLSWNRFSGGLDVFESK